MSGSSPARRSIQSPERHRYGGYLSEERNNLNSHHDALTASKEEHDRVRDHAIRALEKHVFKLEQLRIQDEEENILEKQKREKERLERELRLREEEQRLRELEAQKIPKLPPKLAVETTPAAANTNTTATNGIVKSPQTDANAGILPQAALVSAKPTSKDLSAAERTTGTTPSSNKPDSRQETDNMPRPSPFSTAPPASVSPVPNPFAAAQKPTANPFGQPAAVKPANVFATSAPVAPGTTSIQVAAPVQATPDRYLQIHQSLKKLRAMVKQQMTTNLELKKHVGNMRREIRKSIGQLTGEKGANRQQLAKIRDVLSMSLRGQPASAMVDPAEFVHGPREPVPDAVHNSQLPSLFIYLLNCLSKDIIKQFDGECGPMPDKADPIGVNAAQVFSTREYHWRGQSLIDIMMAKFRVACPVLFGVRGNEKMEQGRIRLGWRKPDGQWEPEQQHFERMSGLGVGYASIALRDFSKAKTINPYPPSNYWASFARIVNTPAAEISDTQCVVLRAMIHLYEEKFINFYGNQAIAALRKALVEFPEKAGRKTPAVTGLTVLASLYQKDLGLYLR